MLPFRCVLILLAPVALFSAPVPGTESFLRQHCAACHNPASRAAGLDLSTLSLSPETTETWVKIHDRVAAGEMPPAPLPRPAKPAVTAFLNTLQSALTAATPPARAGLRRLNAYEYENALHDLLHIPWTQIRPKLPQDGEAFRFNKIGTALDISHVQLARYISTAEYALREAISARLNRPASATTRVYARQEPTLLSFLPREGNTRTDRLNFPVLDSHAQPAVRAGRAPASSPDTRDREAVGRVSSIFSDAGGFSWTSYRIPAPGRYKIRVKGYSIWVAGGGVDHWNFTGFGPEKVAYLYQPSYHRPNPDEVFPGRRSEPIGVYAQSAGQSRPVASFDFTPEPAVREVEVLLHPGEVIQTDAMRLFRTRVNGTEEEYVNPLAQPDGMPGVAFQWLEVEGPLPDENATAGYQLLFGDLPVQLQPGGVKVPAPAPPPSPQEANSFRARFRPRTQDVTVEVISNNPTADAPRLLAAFFAKAARRPVPPAQITPFVTLFNQQFQQGRGFTRSLLAAYTAILCSPEFVYINEPAGPLDNHALASRLSFFLWNSPPDAELRALAARGALANPATLRAQTARLLAHPNSRRFIDAFTDYWLDLRKIDDSSPSTTLYNDYELDDPLKLAAIEETRLFVHDLFRSNAPARHIIHSPATFLNERLAAHYAIPGVSGVAMRKVTLPPNSVRGGLLTQASVLKVTANGTTTSPVVRGVWIMERILGFHVAPPTGVPAIEPDIRGAVTIRQQLDRHRADPTCAACHRKIDPPGFALESFDVMGGFRDRYRAFQENAKPAPGIGFSGQRFAFHHGPPVDAAGALPSGAAFSGIQEFKQLLLKTEERTVARNLVAQLTTFATGAPIRFADRPHVETILNAASPTGYRVADLVHAIVQTPLFRNK